MKKSCVVRNLTVALIIIFSLDKVYSCSSFFRSSDSADRSKRGLITLVPHKSPLESLPPEHRERLNRSKRDPSEPSKIFLSYNDMLKNNNTHTTDSKSKAQETRKTPFDTRINRAEELQPSISNDGTGVENKTKGDTKERQKGRKRYSSDYFNTVDHRNKKRQNKQFTFYFNDGSFAQSKQAQRYPDPRAYEDEDNSAEEYDPSRINYYTPATPMKFNIPTDVQNSNGNQGPLKYHNPNIVINVNGRQPEAKDCFDFYGYTMCPMQSNPQPSINDVETVNLPAQHDPKCPDPSHFLKIPVFLAQKSSPKVTPSEIASKTTTYKSAGLSDVSETTVPTVYVSETTTFVSETDEPEIVTTTTDYQETSNDLIPMSSSNGNYNEVTLTEADVTTVIAPIVKSTLDNEIDDLNPAQQNIDDDTLELVRKAVKKVINNFVPGQSEDLLPNVGHNPNLDSENLLPKVRNTPTVKNLTSIPEIRNMITDKAAELISEIKDRPITDKDRKLIENTLQKIIDQEISDSNFVDEPDDDHWVTNRINALQKSKDSPPMEVLDKIRTIIKQSRLGEKAVANPMIQNMIVKGVKHALDKSKGVIDESTIRKAFRLIVHPNNEEPSSKKKRENPEDASLPVKFELIGEQDKVPSSEHVVKNDTDPAGSNDLNLALDNEQTQVLVEVTPENNTISESNIELGNQQDQVPVEVSPENQVKNDADSDHLNIRLGDEQDQPSLEYVKNKLDPFNNPLHVKLGLENDPTALNNKVYLLIEGSQQTGDSRKMYSYDPSKTQGLAPAGTLVAINLTDLPDLKTSKLAYVSNGMRLPLETRRLEDGSLAITLSDEMCARFAIKKCPCCIPSDSNGMIVRESSLGDESLELDYSDESTESSSEEHDKSTNSLRSNKRRVRRQSGELFGPNRRKTRRHFGVEFDPGLEDVYRRRRINQRRRKINKKHIRTPRRHHKFLRFGKDPPYRYQREADEDQRIRMTTNAIKQVFFLLKNVLTNIAQLD